ncbi:MAG TPA: membrane dipeptidase [Polyangiaceae bacterium]
MIAKLIGTAALGAATFLLAELPARGAETTERPFGVVDLHVDLSYEHNYKGHAFAEGTGQFRAAELERAGVVGVVLPLYVPRRASPIGPRLTDFEGSYEKVYGALAATSPYRLPGCVPRRGGVRTWLAFEGVGALAGDAWIDVNGTRMPASLLAWAARGLRVLGPVHAWANELASSSGDAKPADFGLTPRGRELVRAASRLGIAVDVSHASDRATREILALAAEGGAPVVATHSNARALSDHPRNLADAELRAIAKTGGVVGVNFHSAFVTRRSPATLADVVLQVKHLVRVMGVRHVAIGSDFEGEIRPPAELSDVHGYQRLARALLASGLSRSDVEAVLATNALRVLCARGDKD